MLPPRRSRVSRPIQVEVDVHRWGLRFLRRVYDREGGRCCWTRWSGRINGHSRLRRSSM